MVASRPGYSLADVANALPESLRPRPEVTRPFHKQAATGDLVLKGVTIHLLDEVYQPISSTTIREAAAAGKPLGPLRGACGRGLHQENWDCTKVVSRWVFAKRLAHDFASIENARAVCRLQ